MGLTRDEILSKRALKTETVNIPEWGGDVIVREMTAREGDAYEATFRVDDDMPKEEQDKRYSNMRARLVCLCVVDEKGNRLFKDNDVEEIGNLPRMVLDKIATVASRLSGYDKRSQDASKKNLGANVNSTSASPLH